MCVCVDVWMCANLMRCSHPAMINSAALQHCSTLCTQTAGFLAISAPSSGGCCSLDTWYCRQRHCSTHNTLATLSRYWGSLKCWRFKSVSQVASWKKFFRYTHHTLLQLQAFLLLQMTAVFTLNWSTCGILQSACSSCRSRCYFFMQWVWDILW